MCSRIVTISREFGSGGRTIGKAVAERLKIPCYGQELIGKLAEESGFAKEYVREQSEETPHSGWLVSAFAGRGLDGLSNQEYLWIKQRDIILELSKKESCVIVGRCADYILKDKDKCRSAYYEFYTNVKWGKAKNYHVALDRGGAGD